MYLSFDDWKLDRFEKSKVKNKKYMALLKHRVTGKFRKMNFGDVRYQQYKDSTGLGLYSSKNHLDKKRRKNYRSRHETYIRSGMYSPGYFSMKYLW